MIQECGPHRSSISVVTVALVFGRGGVGMSARLLAAMVFALAVSVLAAGCASFNPAPGQAAGFMQRARTQTRDGVTVTVAVPSAEEAAVVFGVPLHGRKIQPVWVRVENRESG